MQREMALLVLIGSCLSLLRWNVAASADVNSTMTNVNVSTLASIDNSTTATPDLQVQSSLPPNDTHPFPPPPPPGCHGSRLSCGAIAGIVIACIVFVVIVVVVIIIVARMAIKRKQDAAESAESGTVDNATGDDKRQMDLRPKSAKQNSDTTDGQKTAQFPEVKTRRANLPPLETATSTPKPQDDQEKRPRRRRPSTTEDPVALAPARGLPPLSTSSSLVAGNESPEKHRRRNYQDDDDF